jgi:hypothetical protein
MVWLRGRLTRDRILGTVVRVAELETCIASLSDTWTSNQRTVAGADHVGWYRILGRQDRIGTTATAQAMVALTASGAPIPELEPVVHTLLKVRIAGGGWPFVSTLNDRTVIDATAWALMALSPYRHEPSLAALRLPRILDDVATVLESMALPGDGWGLTAGAPYRAYSTALVIRALCADNRERSAAVQSGVDALSRTVDPSTGAWRDNSGRVSVAVTAEVIRALRASAGSRQRHALLIDAAARWLLSVSVQSRLWSHGPFAAGAEEIDIDNGADLRRVEHGFSPRPAAVTALLSSGRPLDPATVRAAAEIVAAQRRGDWAEMAGAPGRHDLSSWMLHDACIATSGFRAQLPAPTGEVWTNGRRVLLHRAGENGLVRFVRRRWGSLVMALAAVGVAVLLDVAGVVAGVGLTVVAFVVTSIALSVVANLLSDYLLKPRQ